MHLEDFGTPAPDSKGGAGGRTKATPRPTASRGEGGGGGGSSERDAERDAAEPARVPTAAGEHAHLAAGVTLT